MFVKLRRRKHAHGAYEYVDIVETRRVAGKIQRITLGTLGRRDQLPPHKIDRLIEHLRKLASPEGRRGLRLGELRFKQSRLYGPVLAAHRLWQELGVPPLLGRLLRPGRSGPTEAAVFRMVANRLCDPQSKLALTEWQTRVEWPNGNGDPDYHHFLRAMDRLLPHRQAIEDQLFFRVTELFSLPLSLVFYDVTSTYFDGDGACELADYGHSSDHRADRAQVVVGLAVTQEGLPITHRVFAGNTVDVTTLTPMTKELRERFGLPAAVIVGDRGMFSDANVQALEAKGFRYVLSLRSREQKEFEAALTAAAQGGLRRPRDLASARTFVEVSLEPERRHVVVYSAMRAEHDYEVRVRRIRRALAELQVLRRRAPKEKLSQRAIVARATRILVQHKAAKYFSYQAASGVFTFRLDRDVYRTERHQDGVFVLKTNHPALTAEAVLQSYLQLQEVERAFRVVKTLLKLRPVYHWRQRRVEAHIFIVFLAFLLAKVLEQKLRAAGLDLSITKALDHLEQLQAVEHTWEDNAVVTQATEPDALTTKILAALDIRLTNPVLRVTNRPAA